MNSYRRHALALNREARDTVAAEKQARADKFRAYVQANTIRDTDADAIPRLQARIDGWAREIAVLPTVVGLGPLAIRGAIGNLRSNIRVARTRIERLQENTP